MIFFQERILKKLSAVLVDSIWAKPYLEKLNGQVIELSVLDTGLVFKVSLEDEVLSILDQEEPSTLVIKGRIQDLMSLAYYARRGDSIPAGCVDISGDLSVMQALQDLILNADNGFKEFLVQSFGPVIAHRLIRAYEYAGRVSAEKTEDMVSQIKEYVIFEKKLLPSSLDFSNMERDLYDLVDAVDSIAFRVDRVLKNRRADD